MRRVYIVDQHVLICQSSGENVLGANFMNSDAHRYKYMSIRQLQDLSKELKEEAKLDPSFDAEYHIVYKTLEDKIRERDRNRPKCIPSRFEHDLDVMEEF